MAQAGDFLLLANGTPTKAFHNFGERVLEDGVIKVCAQWVPAVAALLTLAQPRKHLNHAVPQLLVFNFHDDGLDLIGDCVPEFPDEFFIKSALLHLLS